MKLRSPLLSTSKVRFVILKFADEMIRKERLAYKLVDHQISLYMDCKIIVLDSDFIIAMFER